MRKINNTKFEKEIFSRITNIALHFANPKRLNTFMWSGTSLLKNVLTKEGLLVKKEYSTYQWNSSIPVTYKLACTITDKIRERQSSYNAKRSTKVSKSWFKRLSNWFSKHWS